MTSNLFHHAWTLINSSHLTTQDLYHSKIIPIKNIFVFNIQTLIKAKILCICVCERDSVCACNVVIITLLPFANLFWKSFDSLLSNAFLADPCVWSSWAGLLQRLLMPVLRALLLCGSLQKENKDSILFTKPTIWQVSNVQTK